MPTSKTKKEESPAVIPETIYAWPLPQSLAVSQSPGTFYAWPLSQSATVPQSVPDAAVIFGDLQKWPSLRIEPLAQSSGGIFSVKAPPSIAEITVGSPTDIIKRTRDGLAASVFSDLAAYLDIPQSLLYEAVGVSRSTVAARIKDHKALSASESDKVVRVAKVLERAADVLGDIDQARKWIRREIRSIGGVPPLTLLDTEAGYELVMDTLGRIEHGIAA